MGHEIVYCSRCQSRLKGADFDEGTAVRLSNYVYCATCLTPEEKQLVEKLRKPPEPLPSTRRSATMKAAKGSSGAIATAPKQPAGAAPPRTLILAAAGGGLLLIIIVLVAILM